MNSELLKSSLVPECVILNLKANNRNDAIKELIDSIHSKHHLRNPQEAFNSVIAREEIMSTCMENSIAMPHAKISSIDKVITAIGIKQAGIDFKGPNKQPVKIIVLVLSPVSLAVNHIKCIAEIAKILHSEQCRTSVLQAKDKETVYKVMTSF